MRVRLLLTTLAACWMITLHAANTFTNTENISHADWGNISTPIVMVDTAAAPAFAGGNAGLADTLTDDSTVSAEGKYQSKTIPTDGSSWIASVFIRKDAITSRFPELVIAFENGTVQFRSVSVNTSTGAIANGSEGAPVEKGVVNVDALWWRVWLKHTNNGTNTSGVMGLYAARAIALGGGTAIMATGSIQIWGANFTNTSTLDPYEPHPFYAATAAPKLMLREPGQ